MITTTSMSTSATASSAPRVDARDARWAAIERRSTAADGQFVYGVTSTRIFCRPSCPSRRPRPDRVVFFASAGEAERAGFRACLRCAPSGARPVSAATKAVTRVAAHLRAHADAPVSLAALATLVGLSPSHLQRAFTAHTGISPREFHAACRAERFRRALRRGDDVTTATYDAGYGSPSRVSAQKPTGPGLTPSAYRQGARGETIRSVVLDSPLGTVLVAATDRGICAVRLGESAEALRREVAREFPRASISEARLPAAWTSAVRAAFERAAPVRADVPLDVQGTAFQWAVWRALQAIPTGETRTYAEVARAVGRPRAVRAVASACARNRVALLVPCHRVVPASGGTGQYRWGTRRKAWLLAEEARRTR